MSRDVAPAAIRLRNAANQLVVEPNSVREWLAMSFAVEGHAKSIADQRELTVALGLDAAPPERSRSSADRRAVPDTFRRGRKRGGRHG